MSFRDDDRFCRKCGRLNYWGKDGLVCVRCGIVPEEPPAAPLEEKPSGGSIYYAPARAAMITEPQTIEHGYSYSVDKWHNCNSWHVTNESSCYAVDKYVTASIRTKAKEWRAW